MKSYSVEKNILHENGSPVNQRPDPDGESAPIIKPRFLVIHFTAGGVNAAAYFERYQRPLSVHLVISRNGTVTQMLPFNRKGLHAGASSWKGVSGLNNHSIGIEIENWGPLNLVADHWETWTGQRINDESVVEAAHKNGGPVRGWEKFTDAQLDAVIGVSKALCGRYGLEIVGHDDVAPSRKVDPGPAFPMDRVQSIAAGNADDEPDDNEPTPVIANEPPAFEPIINETAPRLSQPDSLRNLASKKLAVTASGGWSIQSIVTSVLDKFSDPYTLAFGAFAILVIAGLIGWYIYVQGKLDNK